MSKPKTQRDRQARERLSGAALLGTREPTPPVMAVDAQPRAGDAGPMYLVQSGYGFRPATPEDAGRPVYLEKEIDTE